MINRTYKCDLCNKVHSDEHFDYELIGIFWDTNKQYIVEKPAVEVEHHLCSKCISSIQNLPKRCVAGFKCPGGVHCTSDHK